MKACRQISLEGICEFEGPSPINFIEEPPFSSVSAVSRCQTLTDAIQIIQAALDWLRQRILICPSLASGFFVLLVLVFLNLIHTTFSEDHLEPHTLPRNFRRRYLSH
jgi:hypothetical protein